MIEKELHKKFNEFFEKNSEWRVGENKDNLLLMSLWIKLLQVWIVHCAFKCYSRFCHHFWGELTAYAQPAHSIFGMIKNITSVRYRTKNQMCRLCVGSHLILKIISKNVTNILKHTVLKGTVYSLKDKKI